MTLGLLSLVLDLLGLGVGLLLAPQKPHHFQVWSIQRAEYNTWLEQFSLRISCVQSFFPKHYGNGSKGPKMRWLKDQSKQLKLSINFPPFSLVIFSHRFGCNVWIPHFLPPPPHRTSVYINTHTRSRKGIKEVAWFGHWFFGSWVVSSFPPIKKSTLPETNRHSTCQEAIPKGKDCLATIHFQVLSSFSGEHAEKSKIDASHPENVHTKLLKKYLKPGDDCWGFSHLMVKPLVLWKKIIWQKSLHFSDSFGGPVTNLLGVQSTPSQKTKPLGSCSPWTRIP